jgi:hypothetical protein
MTTKIVTQSKPVVKKVRKVAKRSRRQARQFEPSPIRDMDDFAAQNKRLAEIAQQLAEFDDVLFA